MFRTRITKIFTFDSAHTLRHHDGKCRNLHGHTYKLEVTIEGVPQTVDGSNPQSGMILDFGILKQIVKERILDELDHTDLDGVVNYSTAELLAAYIFCALDSHIAECKPEITQADMFLPQPSPTSLYRIRLWETPTSYAEVVDE